MTPKRLAAAGLRVKPIEWTINQRSARADWGGRWMVWEYADPLNDGKGNWMWQSLDVQPHRSGRCKTQADAVSAVNADAEARILAALEEG